MNGILLQLVGLSLDSWCSCFGNGLACSVTDLEGKTVEKIKSKFIKSEEGDFSFVDFYEVNGHIVMVATPTMGRDGVAITTVN